MLRQRRLKRYWQIRVGPINGVHRACLPESIREFKKPADLPTADGQNSARCRAVNLWCVSTIPNAIEETVARNGVVPDECAQTTDLSASSLIRNPSPRSDAKIVA